MIHFTYLRHQSRSIIQNKSPRFGAILLLFLIGMITTTQAQAGEVRRIMIMDPELEIINNWQTIAKSKLARISVEHKLYRENNEFFLHVRIENPTKEPIGFLSKKAPFFISQWGPSSSSGRGIIDERRVPVMVPDREQQVALMRRYSSGDSSFTKLPAGETTDHFVAFFGPERSVSAVEEQCKAPGMNYIVFVMDGQLTVTNGKTIVFPGRDELSESRGEFAAEVSLPLPLVWVQMPKKRDVLYTEQQQKFNRLRPN